MANMPYKIPYKYIAIIMKDMICSDRDKKSSGELDPYYRSRILEKREKDL